MKKTPTDQTQEIIAVEACRLARVLPLSVAQTIASAIREGDLRDQTSAKMRILQEISHPQYRNLAFSFLKTCEIHADVVSAEAIALALITASHSEKTQQEEENIELVWTGPDVGAIPLRRTEQALLQIIESAVQRLLVVSYAVYNIPHICDALVRAAGRGVAIQIVIETPDRIHGEEAYNTFRALGHAVENSCEVYFWPFDNRKKDQSGKPGILHVKCAVADGRRLFLSSANLTEYAFNLNMELGVLITGGAAPGQVEEHFSRMFQVGVFESIRNP